MRGDPPYQDSALFSTLLSTPHARGSTRQEQLFDEFWAVYPACAGIHPPRSAARVRS